MPVLRFLTLIYSIVALFAGPAYGAENWGLCHVPVYQELGTGSDTLSEVDISADHLLLTESNQAIFNGQVHFTRMQLDIKADYLRLDKHTNQVQAEGNVIFEDSIYKLSARELSLNQDDETATFLFPSFEMRDRHVRGQARKIEKLDASRSRFDDMLYTSCDPGDRDWHLKASKLTIDDETGRGTATHTTLYFQDIPFLYLPYFMFPIDDRRMSGMLTPFFSYSDSKGSNITVPVYWNIAPNLDATITPAWYSERGLQLNTENRYLFSRHTGQVSLSHLNDDQSETSRWFQNWQHQADFGFDIKGDLVLQEVSDKDFFDDFDVYSRAYSNVVHLERHIELKRKSDNWSSKLLWQNHQTIDDNISIISRPYHRLPRLTVNSRFKPLPGGTEFGLNNEWVRFEREQSVTGSRLHIQPSVSWPVLDDGYFVIPSLQYALTEYDLEENDDNSIYRALPTFSLDSGLILERLAGSRNNWLQTLEPRLYFVRTPFENQDDIPDFDTAIRSESYNNFFKPNRFSGADRIGDAYQLTFGLGTRFLDIDNGNELLYLRAAQIFYRQDRQVSLNNKILTRRRSNLVAEIGASPMPYIKVAARTIYDEEDKEFTSKNLSINYANSGYAANVEYFFTADILEQSVISAVYPLNERWTLVAKQHESLLFDKPVEYLLGLSYESCCWGLKMLLSHSGNEDDDFAKTDRAIFFELTLKGLSQVGQDIDDQLEKSISGYRSSF